MRSGASGAPWPSVWVVVVHWAGIDDTVECLASLSRVDYPYLAVVLVDNGSSDFEETRVRQAFTKVQIITSDENLGFAGGSNLGITKALREGAGLIMLLNNDTVVRSDLFLSLLPALQAQDVGIVGPTITYYAAPGRIWFAGGTYSRLLGYTRHPLMDEQLHRPYENRRVDYITGCALLAKREVFEAVGMLGEGFFLYFEDADFCLRAAKARYRSVVVGETLVRHKVSASAGIRGTNRLSPEKAYYYGRNPILLLRRNVSGPYAVTGTLGQFAVRLPFYVLRCIAARDMKSLCSYLAGMRDGILGRSGKKPT